MDILRKLLAALFAGALLLSPIACSDEDGDGATTDEEVDELDQQADETGDQIEEEIDQGEEEVDENNEGG